MPRNGSGVYTLPSGGFNPAVSLANIPAPDWNSVAADLAQAISESISTTGVTATTAAVPFAAGILMSAGTAAAPGARFIGDTDTGIFSPGANSISFSTGGTQRWSVDGSGNLRAAAGAAQVLAADGAVGAPEYSFASDPDTGIYSSAANQIAIATAGVQRWLFLANGNLNMGSGAGQFLPADGTAAAPGIAFSNDSDTGLYRPGANRLGFATAGAAAWEINASGDLSPASAARGIYLGGTAASNFLNQYEEGSFTPSVSFATPGTSSFVYTIQSGTYRRIGNLVAFNVRLDFTPTIGTGSGQININGLPFTSGAERQAITIGFLDRLTTFAASATMVHARTVPSTTTFIMAFAGPAVVPSSVAASNLTSGTAMSWNFSGAYYV